MKGESKNQRTTRGMEKKEKQPLVISWTPSVKGGLKIRKRFEESK